MKCAWLDLEPIKLGGGFRVIDCAVFDPIQNQVVFPAIFFESQFAPVFLLHGRLEQEQALFWGILVRSWTFILSDQFRMILVEVVTKERELKIALAGKRTVALSSITAPHPK